MSVMRRDSLEPSVGAVIGDNSQRGPGDGIGDRHELTVIPGSVQLSATNETLEPLSEHDKTIVNAFLDTLAQVALAVAGRRTTHGDKGGEVEP